VVFAASIDRRLRADLEHLARRPGSYAEINRRLGARAEARGLARPSYARVRQLVQEVRQTVAVPGWAELLLDVDMRRRPPGDLLDKLGGTWPMDEDAGIKGWGVKP
jgi:hypothetical protein